MNKRKKRPDGHGVMAIALFEIAVALERWAAAQERIATSNTRIADSHEGHLALAEDDFEFRKHGAEEFLAKSQTTIDGLADEVRRDARWHGETPPLGVSQYIQADRDELFFSAPEYVTTARKTARILARRTYGPFIVETDRGPMTGAAGDWLVTNHPDDDPGSDLWTISGERFEATYEVLPDGRTHGAEEGK